MAEAQVIGNILNQLKQFILAKYGQADFDMILGLIPDEHKAIMTGKIRDMSWYPEIIQTE